MLVYVRGILTGVGQLSTWVGSDNGDRSGALQSESRYKQLYIAPVVKKWDKSLSSGWRNGFLILLCWIVINPVDGACPRLAQRLTENQKLAWLRYVTNVWLNTGTLLLLNVVSVRCTSDICTCKLRLIVYLYKGCVCFQKYYCKKQKIFEPMTLRHVHMLNSDHPCCLTKCLFMGGGCLK